jgi:hypothetical protein
LRQFGPKFWFAKPPCEWVAGHALCQTWPDFLRGSTRSAIIKKFLATKISPAHADMLMLSHWKRLHELFTIQSKTFTVCTSRSAAIIKGKKAQLPMKLQHLNCAGSWSRSRHETSIQVIAFIGKAP